MSISDEAVEAASRAYFRGANWDAPLAAWYREQCLEYARAALEAAAPYMHAEANAEIAKLREHILDIDAHATPFGDIPDDPGYVGTYLVSAGALHRALGKIGHSAPSCEAEAKLADAWDEGYQGCYDRYMYEPVPANPYRSQA